MNTPTSCNACGSYLNPGNKFCAKCGANIRIDIPDGKDRLLIMDLMRLKNNTLDVVSVGDDRIDIKGQVVSKWFLGRVTIRFDGRLKHEFRTYPHAA